MRRGLWIFLEVLDGLMVFIVRLAILYLLKTVVRRVKVVDIRVMVVD